MDGLTIGAIVAVVAFLCSLCSLASFLLGRKKAAEDQGKKEGSLATDLEYIKNTVSANVESVNALSNKLDAQNAQRETEYREMLVRSTELTVKYDIMNSEVSSIKKEIAKYHH